MSEFGRPGEGEGQINRRDFVKAAGFGVAGLAASSVELSAGETHQSPKNPEQRERRKTGRRIIETGELAGVELNEHLFQLYLGKHKGPLPPKIWGDFQEKLGDLWKLKKRRSLRHPEVARVGNEVLEEYDTYEPTYTDLVHYNLEAQHCIEDIKQQLAWEDLGKLQGLSAEDVQLLKDICSNITGKDLLAYSLTELMPSKNGSINARVLDLLLKNAGREFVENIPALRDPLVSKGTYQFTKYALDGSSAEPAGASRINVFLPKELRVPDSVEELRGPDHHKAAFLYMIQNFSSLLRVLKYGDQALTSPQGAPLTEKQNSREVLSAMRAAVASKPEHLAVFAAVAHHAPTSPIQSFERWLETGAQGSFVAQLKGRFIDYAERTIENRKALEQLSN